jgi:hypothetical protein
VTRVSYDEAYPGIEFLPRSRNWWARLKGSPAECIHLDEDPTWMATLLPDTLYLRGKRFQRRGSVRPEVSLCRKCLVGVVADELASYEGRIVAFEPDPESFSQYFFVASPEFAAAGLKPETSAAIESCIAEEAKTCSECSRPANWIWFSRERVSSLDDVEKIRGSEGEWFCPAHGAGMLCVAFQRIPEANVFYMNLPYGDAGAYVWI